MSVGQSIIAALDRVFNYMPPLEHKKAAPQVPKVAPDTDPMRLRERIASHTPLSPQIPGTIAANGQLSPEQRAHVMRTSTQATDTDVITAQLESIGKKAASVIIGSTGSAIAAGQSAGEAIASGAGAAVPVIVASADAAMLGIGLVDMFGGDVAIPTYAPMSPEFDASTAAGRFHGAAEAVVIKQSLIDTGGAVKFRTSGQLTDDSIAA